ncbi:hypothetical protein MSAN_00668300 [Mycena sanguinolenta]|uniref:Uncharacterized protein n=1 Tax=Mycena sanguinolenta TaxID=230812 RepID=A0A8H6Z0F2_9AGAR|nr:hypothetical protein MSAN_00668300 [Mycena sanguinolenta]
MSSPNGEDGEGDAHPAITLHITDLACPDPLEKIFQQVEERNERRAREEEVESKDNVPSSIQRVESSENVKKGRRRGSISITRFGQLSISDATSDGSSVGPTTPALSDIAAKSPFFRQQLKNGSQSSFASGGSAADDADAHREDDHHVTHIHAIAPKQSISRAVGGFLPRRLSRARSVLPTGVGSAAASDVGAEVAATVVHAPGALHHKQSKASISGGSLNQGTKGWAARAKNFIKFRRKSKVPLGADAVNA